MEGPRPTWSDAVEEADWIADRLTPFFDARVTSCVPAGFAGYCRVLHPAEVPAPGGEGRLVRWREVAAWSGLALRPDAPFHAVALPREPPTAPAPWRGQGPRLGQLYLPDARVLAELLGATLARPARCWFCLWEGYGWDGELAGSTDPVPRHRHGRARVRPRRRVRLPNRDYLLWSGAPDTVDAAAAATGAQSPNLWWPADRTWCVATEVDLAWSYVGGPAELVARLLADERIEALPASPDDPITRVEAWVEREVDAAVPTLLGLGAVTITTTQGTVRAELERPGPRRDGALRVRSDAANGVRASAGRRLAPSDDAALAAALARDLTEAVIALVGG